MRGLIAIPTLNTADRRLTASDHSRFPSIVMSASRPQSASGGNASRIATTVIGTARDGNKFDRLTGSAEAPLSASSG
jgi:hypothetical protein